MGGLKISALPGWGECKPAGMHGRDRDPYDLEHVCLGGWGAGQAAGMCLFQALKIHHWSVRELKVTSSDSSTGRDTTWSASGRRDGSQSESSSDVMIVWGSTLLPSDPGIA